MTLAAVFRPEAQADALQTRDWYERQQPGLGEIFSVALNEAVIRIESNAADVCDGVSWCPPKKASNVSLPDLLSRAIGSNRSNCRATWESRSQTLAGTSELDLIAKAR